MTTRAGALYICYFGLREPLVQTQVLPYLRELVAGGIGMSLLTFEPKMKSRWTSESITAWQHRLRGDGIEWYRLPYHERPSLLATIYDIVVGAWRAASIARREKVEVFHGRSHVGAAIGALARRLSGSKLIFDVRGFLADEYADSGNWRANGLAYRLTKMAERWLYRHADGFVVLTVKARGIVLSEVAGGRPIEVIPCCVDLERFAIDSDRDAVRAELDLTNRTVLVYAGVLGGYYLIDETADLFVVARENDPRVFALILTQSSPAAMTAALTKRGVSSSDFRVMKVQPDDVPKYLRAADVALALVRPSYARQSMSPTKFAEYLAAGLPVIATSGIGDLDAHIEEGRVGVLLNRLDRDAYRQALLAIHELRRDPELAARCRAVARNRYDLQTVGGARYRRLYDKLLPS